MKSYDENRSAILVHAIVMVTCDLVALLFWPMRISSAAARSGALRPDLGFIIMFRKIIPNTLIFIQRRPSRFSTISAKIRVLKLNIF
jgi:hypothetical protein